MPSAPPAHVPPGYVGRKPWVKSKQELRGSTRTWRKLRLAVFQRDGYRCQTCGRITGHPECDHVVPVAEGGTTTMANLATRCTECHKAKTAAESGRGHVRTGG